MKPRYATRSLPPILRVHRPRRGKSRRSRSVVRRCGFATRRPSQFAEHDIYPNIGSNDDAVLLKAELAAEFAGFLQKRFLQRLAWADQYRLSPRPLFEEGRGTQTRRNVARRRSCITEWKHWHGQQSQPISCFRFL